MMSRLNFLIKIKNEKIVNLIGIDPGSRYIGVSSCTDAFGNRQYSSIITLDRRICNLPEEISKYSSNIHGIIVGLSDNEAVKSIYVKDIIKELSALNIPIVFSDENYTSARASQILHKINPKYSRSPYLINQVAACVILDNFISYYKKKLETFPKTLEI